MALNKSLEKAKTSRDEDVANSELMKSEQERLSRVANEEAEGWLRAEAEGDATVKALEEKKADQKAFEEQIKKSLWAG